MAAGSSVSMTVTWQSSLEALTCQAVLPPMSICFFSPSWSATSGIVTIWVMMAEGPVMVWMHPPSAEDLPPVAASMSADLRTPQVSRPAVFFLVVILMSPCCLGAVGSAGLEAGVLVEGFFEAEGGVAGDSALGSAVAEPVTCSLQPVRAARGRISARRMAAGRRCMSPLTPVR
jgi:hypothetical protein